MAKPRKAPQAEVETTNGSTAATTQEGETPMSEATAPEKQKRDRKYNFGIEGSVVTVEELASGEKQIFDFATLPAEIQAQLGPFGLAAKLSNASAGKSGAEATTALSKVWDSLTAGQWTVRAPAEKKLTASDLKGKLENMSPEEAAAAQALLAKLGMKLG